VHRAGVVERPREGTALSFLSARRRGRIAARQAEHSRWQDDGVEEPGYQRRCKKRAILDDDPLHLIGALANNEKRRIAIEPDARETVSREKLHAPAVMN